MSTIIVTGSASGIGASTASALRAGGSRVIGLDRRDAEVIADLASPQGRRIGIERALAACDGRLDGLVCSAGLGPTEDPARIVAVNYFGAIAMLDGLLPALRRASPAAAVLLASTGATQLEVGCHPLDLAMLEGDKAAAESLARDCDGLLAYCASKHALACAMRRRVLAFGQAGVRVNAVAPGPVDTPLLRALDADPRYTASSEFVPPVGRRAQPAEVADLIAYLLSARGAFIHGSLIFIDGGIDALTRPDRF